MRVKWDDIHKAPGRMCSKQVLVSFSFPSFSGFGFIESLLKNLHHPDLGIDLRLGSSEPGRWLSYETSLPQIHSYLSHLLDAVTTPDFVVVVKVADKLAFYFHFHFWFVYNIYQIYFFCKDFVTEPELKSFSWSSSHITFVFWNISWAYFVPVCFKCWRLVPYVGITTSDLCQVDFR